MSPDPTWWIIGAALVSAAIGFFGCALCCARTIRTARDDSYWEGYSACNRAHSESNPKL